MSEMRDIEYKLKEQIMLEKSRQKSRQILLRPTHGWKGGTKDTISPRSMWPEKKEMSAKKPLLAGMNVRELVRGYTPRDVWNLDETGLFWKALPEKSLSERGKRCRGGKTSKQRFTWAYFVSASGDKEDRIVVGKSAKPRCFKGLKNATRPYT